MSYKLIIDGCDEYDFSYEEMVQIFHGYVWTGSDLTGDEHWHSAREKVRKIKLTLPRTDY